MASTTATATATATKNSALNQLPPHVTPLLAQARQLLRAGRTADAVVQLREVTRWLPGNPSLLHDLGLACLESGQVHEAIDALRASIAADPRLADSYLRLGIALEIAGYADAALAAYQKAATFAPVAADANNRAGSLLASVGLLEQAAAVFRLAAAQADGTTVGRIAMARALLAENRDAEAEKVLRRVLSLERDNATALELLGQTLTEAGRFEEARRHLLRAIDRSPALAGNYYEVARCARIGREDAALVGRMRAALESPSLDRAQRVRIHLALGKSAADLGDHPEAMRQFDAAQAVRDPLVGFDPGRFDARVDRLIARMERERFAQSRSTTANAPSPIVIVGLPRSGTTLVEQILSAHPQVGAGGELKFWNERGGEWERTETELETELLSRSAGDYLALLQRVAPGAAFVTDKMPLNFQWAGLIHLALPQATIVHCRRDLLDTALSIHQTHFNPRLKFPTGGADLVRYVRTYEKLCAHWRSVLPAACFVEMKYESLVENPESNIRALLSACNLSWNDACLAPERNRRIIKTPSKWQVRQPINSGSVGRWRHYHELLGPLANLRLPDNRE